MSALREDLLAQCRHYPQLAAADILKFLYQRCFGAEHLLGDVQDAYRRLLAEWQALRPRPEQVLLEPLGNGLARLHLARAKADGIPVQTVFALFCWAQQEAQRDMAGFAADLAEALQLCRQGQLPCSASELEDLAQSLLSRGLPPCHHSPGFRALYQPAYRLVREQQVQYHPLITRLAVLQERQQSLVVAVDGRAAAGKSTLAAFLQQHYAASVVHMDHFFLPGELRTPARYAQPGGNVHYERFLAEVAPHLQARRPFCYRRFDCGRMAYAESIAVDAGGLVVVEGAYSLIPPLRSLYDLAVFYDISPDLQRQRLLQREGEAGSARFFARWIPLEEAYIAACLPQQQCQVLLQAADV